MNRGFCSTPMLPYHNNMQQTGDLGNLLFQQSNQNWWRTLHVDMPQNRGKVMWMKQHFTKLNSSCFWTMPLLRPVGGKIIENQWKSVSSTWMAYSLMIPLGRGSTLALQTFNNQILLGVIFGNISPIHPRSSGVNKNHTTSQISPTLKISGPLQINRHFSPARSRCPFFTTHLATRHFHIDFCHVERKGEHLEDLVTEIEETHGCWSDNMYINQFA